MVSIVAICNIEGLMLDVIGMVVKHRKSNNEKVKNLKEFVKTSLNHNEFPYDWNVGKVVYITFLSAIFLGSIVMEVSTMYPIDHGRCVSALTNTRSFTSQGRQY